MTIRLQKELGIWFFGLMIMTLGMTGCGTLTGATVGGAAGAGIGAATGSSVGKSAAIGAGVGGTAGAAYDIYNYNRRDRFDD
jgi:outer membrane lipoprotein SlyB